MVQMCWSEELWVNNRAVPALCLHARPARVALEAMLTSLSMQKAGEDTDFTRHRQNSSMCHELHENVRLFNKPFHGVLHL